MSVREKLIACGVIVPAKPRDVTALEPILLPSGTPVLRVGTLPKRAWDAANLEREVTNLKRRCGR